jgi:hypothetical protein
VTSLGPARRASAEGAWWQADPRALAAFRTALGLAAVVKAGILAVSAPLLVTAEPPLPALGEMSLRALLPPSVVPVLLLALGVFGLLLAMGAQARLSAGIVALLSGALLLFEGRMWSNHLLLLALLATLSAAAGGGAWRDVSERAGAGAGTRSRVHAPAAVLVCTQVAIVYLFAGLSKLSTDFLDGSVLAAELAAGPAAGWFVEPARELLVAMSVAAVAVEIALPVLLWLPRTRRWGALVGVGLHVGILVTVAPWPDLVVFALLMLGAYPLFLSRAPLRRTVGFTPLENVGGRPVPAA